MSIGYPKCPACGTYGIAGPAIHGDHREMTCLACGSLYLAVASVEFKALEVPPFPMEKHWSEAFAPATGGLPVRGAKMPGVWVFEGRCHPPVASHVSRWVERPDADEIKDVYDDAETWDQPHPGLFLARYRGLLREAWGAVSPKGRTVDPVALRTADGELIAVMLACKVGPSVQPSTLVTVGGETPSEDDLVRVRNAHRLEGSDPSGEAVH